MNGSALPDVHFDIGESYAGTLPITSNKNDHNRLWFWFFPSENPAAKKEITIWLNGGPGCSSLDGLFQENGYVQSSLCGPRTRTNSLDRFCGNQELMNLFQTRTPGST